MPGREGRREIGKDLERVEQCQVWTAEWGREGEPAAAEGYGCIDRNFQDTGWPVECPGQPLASKQHAHA